AFARALEKCSDADFDKPSPEHLQKMFKTTGDLWVLIATHQMMHAGQFVPVRRALGKPVLI
ncbi:MAG TPA: DinB family protein, partial [Gemmatales bacterium]|nr:DinB family protein [Gemmatales bacterium]